MASLANQTISSSYDGLIKTSTDNALPVSGVQLLEDGSGNSSAISIGRANNGVSISGNLAVDTNTLYVDAADNSVSIGDAASFGTLRVGHTGDNINAVVIGDGSTPANDTGIYMRSDTLGVISVGSTAALSFRRGGGSGTESMRIDSSGNVGVKGNALLAAGLGYAGDTTSAGAGTIELYDTSTGAMIINGFGAGYLPNSGIQFQVAGSERMRIDSSGNVGIGGIADSSYKLHLYGTGTSEMAFEATGAGGGFFRVGAGTTASGFAGAFRIYDVNAAAERMRITSGGDVLFSGRTSFSDWTANSGFYHQYRGATIVTRDGSTVMDMNRLTSDGIILEFRKDSVGVGSISTNGNSLPSDRDFKKDISDLNLGLDFVSTLQPKQYRYKISDDNSPLLYGIIAQDLEQSLLDFGVNQNEAIILQTKEKETEQDSGYALDYLKLTPILINAIKELKAEIESLKAQING